MSMAEADERTQGIRRRRRIEEILRIVEGNSGRARKQWSVLTWPPPASRRGPAIYSDRTQRFQHQNHGRKEGKEREKRKSTVNGFGQGDGNILRLEIAAPYEIQAGGG